MALRRARGRPLGWLCSERTASPKPSAAGERLVCVSRRPGLGWLEAALGGGDERSESERRPRNARRGRALHQSALLLRIIATSTAALGDHFDTIQSHRSPHGEPPGHPRGLYTPRFTRTRPPPQAYTVAFLGFCSYKTSFPRRLSFVPVGLGWLLARGLERAEAQLRNKPGQGYRPCGAGTWAKTTGPFSRGG